jgi:oligopeptide transport system permease protein
MKHAIWVALTGSLLARTCSAILIGIVALAMLGPSISGWSPQQIDWQALDSGPNAGHWFGTDMIGRDLFTRSMLGARVSLGIALVATIVSVVIGIPWGALAGYIGGRTDQFMMRIVDTLYALPFVLVVILLVVVFGRNPILLFAGLGAVFWLDIARIVRGQTLQIRQQPYIAAAQTLGATTTHIVWHHVIPNVSGPALVYATLTVPGVILAESFISFLGLGVQEPDTSWGVLIADATQTMESAPWALVFPVLLLGMTVWCCNMLGDRLRDQVDALTSSRHRRIPMRPSAG